MEIGNIIPHIEALIFASDRPLTAIDITELINNAFGFMEDKITMDQVESALEGIVEKYRSEFYPFEMRESGGGWQFLTKKEFHKTVAQLNGEKFLKRLSNAALETLAIIAYKQPVTKSDIEAIRGVSSDYSIQKLLEKELIVITGRNEELPGKPLVYQTSKSFMDYFGLNSTEDLPKIKEIFDEYMVTPTGMHQAGSEEPDIPESEETLLVVRDNGELAEGGSPESLDNEEPPEEADNFIDSAPGEEGNETINEPDADEVGTQDDDSQTEPRWEPEQGEEGNEENPGGTDETEEKKTPGEDKAD